MAYILQTAVLRHSHYHRHIFHIESADKQKSVPVEALSICRNILQEDISVDVREKHIIGISLKQRSISTISFDDFSYTVQSGVIIS